MAFQRGLMCIIFWFCFPHPPLYSISSDSWRGILFTFFSCKCHDMGIFLHGMVDISHGLLYRWLVMVKPGGCSRDPRGSQ
ncbi:hypothetical protein J3F84DRAFT_362806 [Trichoderma pleuroticola]